MLCNRIAQVKKAGASGRSSRANTPTGNPFAPQQQSMPSFQLPQQTGGDGGAFNFSVNAPSNPFQNANGASGTPPPAFGMGQQQQQNGAGGMFGNNGNNTSFGFGSNAPAQAQTNGFSFGSNTTNGNSAPSFGGFGQNNQTQGQQNGTTPSSTTPSFNFGGQANGNTNTQFQFGQSQPQTQSTQGTSFNFGQNTQTNGDKPAATSFGGIGQATQQKAADKPPTPSFSFGQTAQQADPKPTTPSLSFGGQSKEQPAEKSTSSTSNIFGQSNSTQAQTNGSKTSLFGAASQPEQTPKANAGGLFTFNSSNQGIGNRATPEATANPSDASKAPMSNLFGTQRNAGPGLFGSTPPPPRESSATPKPGESIFSTQNKPKLGGNLFTSEMAEGKRPESPAPIFGQPAQQKEQAAPDTERTPKPTNNLFSGFGQSQANAARDTSKQSSNLFSASDFGKTPSQPATATKSLFGQSIQDTSMNTPESTPQKPSLFAPTASQKSPAAQEEPATDDTPAPGRSLFDRTSWQSQTSTAVEKPPSEQYAAPPSETSSTAQKPSFAPSSSAFTTPASQQPTSASLFSKPSENVVAQGSASQRAATSQGGRPASTRGASTTSAGILSDDEKGTLKVLNEGLIAHLATQDPTADWTTIMEYYLQQAAIIRHKPTPNLASLSAPPMTAPISTHSTDRPIPSQRSSTANDPAPPQQPTPRFQAQAAPTGAPKSNTFGSSKSAAPKAPSLFRSASGAQETPKSSFFQPPATAPVNRKRSAEDEPERPPATEKRSKGNESIEYPKLPGNASDVSKLFYNALENKTGSDKPVEKATSHTVPPATATAQPKPSGGFTPSTTGVPPSTSGFKSSTSGFTPSASSSGSNNFLAAFGKRASEEQEKDRRKRRDEDFDEDDETEEEWAERDRKEQEAKRAKALEDAKGSGFMFKPTSKPAEKGSPIQQNKNDSNRGKDKSAESGQGGSLFDRISTATPAASEKPSLFATQTPGSKTPTTNIFGSAATPAGTSLGSSLFGHLNKPPESADKGEAVEKQTQGFGDNTWKQSTPIKFGGSASTEDTSTTPAAPPPTFGSLFGPKAQTTGSGNTGLLNVPASKPAMGFNFGTIGQTASASGSRATTPGVTTDGEETGASTAGDADNEPSDEPPANEAQVEDMTGLTAEEIKGETLLHSVTMSKASKWEDKKHDDGGMAQGWVDKGKGPLYLLQNDDTGKVRVLLKVPPYGAAKMNFPVMKGGGYEVQGKAGKQITGTFYDHLAEKKGLGRWLIQVGKKEDADEVGRILRENTPKE